MTRLSGHVSGSSVALSEDGSSVVGLDVHAGSWSSTGSAITLDADGVGSASFSTGIPGPVVEVRGQVAVDTAILGANGLGSDEVMSACLGLGPSGQPDSKQHMGLGLVMYAYRLAGTETVRCQLRTSVHLNRDTPLSRSSPFPLITEVTNFEPMKFYDVRLVLRFGVMSEIWFDGARVHLNSGFAPLSPPLIDTRSHCGHLCLWGQGLGVGPGHLAWRNLIVTRYNLGFRPNFLEGP